ncbi:Mrp family chromosome partitioning ATPase [Hypnocyclicus thermotrophus]|uniref:Mrp family chromosome partitioning ATPase n=1 Tax=Hypnocyclicus thermotrophus TaxID=1627895 RepID=A0AA46E0E8_9FUSO|nr:AAA family ATPase [Hypnocyclicus thermotrophus]TDT72441.1 Mrp family chromosome partitioning ATPase [Hypnocyclicus thermotrophus]
MKLKKRKQIIPFYILQKHIILILIVGILSFFVVWNKLKNTVQIYYESTGILEIDPVIVPTFSINSFEVSQNSITQYYEKYVGTQIKKITSKKIVKSALKKLTKEELKALYGSDEINDFLVNIFIRKIKVEYLSNTHLVKISLQSKQKIGIEHFINYLMKEYINESNDNKIIEDNFRIQYLIEEKKKIESEIQGKLVLVKKIAQEIGTGNFDSSDMPYKSELNSLETSYVEVYKNKIEQEKKYFELKNEIETIKKMPIEKEIKSLLIQDSVYKEIKLNYIEKINKLNDELDSIPKGSNKEKQILGKIKVYQNKIEELEKETKYNLKKNIEKSREYDLKIKELNAKTNYESAKKQEEAIKEQLEEIRGKYSEISLKILEAQELNFDILQLKTSLSEIKNRISYLISETKNPGRLKILESASKVYGPAGNDAMKRKVIALVLAFGWISFLCFIYEILDQRIKTPQDVKYALGFSSAWPISHLKKGNFISASLYNTHSVIYKAIKSLVTKLNIEREKHGAKIAVINGVDKKSGVTELIINAAHTMRENCDKVLILELNTESANIAKKMHIDIDRNLGLKDYLTGKKLNKCIYKDYERNIDILHMGGIINITNKTIKEILEDLKQEYDFIFIDSAPVMQSAMTEYLLLQSDIAVLVIHGNYTTHSKLIKTVELINQFEIDSFTTVINWGRVGKFKR